MCQKKILPIMMAQLRLAWSHLRDSLLVINVKLILLPFMVVIGKLVDMVKPIGLIHIQECIYNMEQVVAG
jgi:hypothetical protein